MGIARGAKEGGAAVTLRKMCVDRLRGKDFVAKERLCIALMVQQELLPNSKVLPVLHTRCVRTEIRISVYEVHVPEARGVAHECHATSLYLIQTYSQMVTSANIYVFTTVLS